MRKQLKATYLFAKTWSVIDLWQYPKYVSDGPAMESPVRVSALECTIFVHSIFQCFHVELFSCCTVFIFPFPSCCVLVMSCPFLCCPFFILHFFSCYNLPSCNLPYCTFPCSTNFMLHSFHIALCPYWTFFLFYSQKHPDIKFRQKRKSIPNKLWQIQLV